jgi:hypothetical protein
MSPKSPYLFQIFGMVGCSNREEWEREKYTYVVVEVYGIDVVNEA